MKYTCALLAVLALIGTPSHGSTLPRHNVALERQEQNVNVVEILKNLLTRLTKIGIDSALSMVGFDLNQVKELKENWDLALKVMRTVLEKTKELLASLKEYRDCMQAQGREFNEERMDNAIRAYESLLSIRTEVENDRFIIAGLLTIYSTYKSIKTTYQATVQVVAALVEVYQAVEPLLDELFPEQMDQLRTIIATVAAEIEKITDGVEDAFENAMNTLEQLIVNAFLDMIRVVSEKAAECAGQQLLPEGIPEGIPEGVPDAGDLIDDLPDAGDLIDDLPDAGDLIDDLPDAGDLIDGGGLTDGGDTGVPGGLSGGLFGESRSDGNPIIMI
ncbi:unnamed protein product [Cyprideis torosa]|uniref:Uncharacterized protein n=1 Tax=Cyprideis torosa TaxID=163714 RepID=A0A7R8WJQ4_9CRUS|nr:unnamed protein product [Cyprideis torosa]CAG0900452.1 unnamed protein product [Cyprideis torosa]